MLRSMISVSNITQKKVYRKNHTERVTQNALSEGETLASIPILFCGSLSFSLSKCSDFIHSLTYK